MDPAWKLVFDHRGELDHGRLQQLLAHAEEASVRFGDTVTLRKRLFNVLVEGLENLNKHAPADHRNSAFAMLVERGDGYRMFIGNAVPLATAALLVHRVGILNEMEEVDLKEHFLRLLANDGRTGQGGAGLGLITMARKSARPMVMHTFPRDEQTAYFALEVTVLRTK